MTQVIALIPTNLQRSALGMPSRLSDIVAGKSVLEHTLSRVAAIDAVRTIVLVHPPGQNPRSLIGTTRIGRQVETFTADAASDDPFQPMRVIARKWAPHAWRGGLGGATCYDELLPAQPLHDAMCKFNADSAVLIGADWMLVDPQLAGEVLALHLQHGEGMPMTFSTAPPGLAGIAIGRGLAKDLADNRGSFGQMLAYSPARAQADPIGRDVCVHIPGSIRSCAHRFIYDTSRSVAMIDALAGELGHRLHDADAGTITDTIRAFSGEQIASFAPLPQQVTLELTPRRSVAGPIVPQHHVTLDRPDISTEQATKIIEQIANVDDTTLTLGGLGDALLHPYWRELVAAAKNAGVFSVAVETDLLVDQQVLTQLLDSGVDVVSVRLNADRAQIYQQMMGVDAFKQVIDNLQFMLNERNRRAKEAMSQADAGASVAYPGVPWLIPRLIKTPDTLPDMETFFDRWVHYMGHAVIDPATTGCGLMPEQSPLPMAPPKRTACRQVQRRMTIHSTGRVARCDQDWLTRATAGDTAATTLADIWRDMRGVREQHQSSQWQQLQLCGSCTEWHRP